jgi:hypothetical protein
LASIGNSFEKKKPQSVQARAGVVALIQGSFQFIERQRLRHPIHEAKPGSQHPDSDSRKYAIATKKCLVSIVSHIFHVFGSKFKKGLFFLFFFTRTSNFQDIFFKISYVFGIQLCM